LGVEHALEAPGRGGGEGVRIRDHLANVRTFLAWLRTGLVLLALGYALTKFEVIGRQQTRWLGVVTAAAGWLVVALAGVSFMRQRHAIESAVFAPSTLWNLSLIVLAAVGGGAILVYLAR
jgi:putative membrane protein